MPAFPQTTALALPYTAIEPHIPISGRVVLGEPGGQANSAT